MSLLHHKSQFWHLNKCAGICWNRFDPIHDINYYIRENIISNKDVFRDFCVLVHSSLKYQYTSEKCIVKLVALQIIFSEMQFVEIQNSWYKCSLLISDRLLISLVFRGAWCILVTCNFWKLGRGGGQKRPMGFHIYHTLSSSS